MQLSPGNWLVSWAGFVYDWIITRQWRQALLCLLPTLLLAGLGLAVAAGGWIDRGRLAQRYLERGNEEVARSEQARSSTPANPSPASAAPASAAPASGAPASADSSSARQTGEEDDAQGDTQIEVSAFAEALFRRVQLLQPSDRSQFIIATALAQRGALQQAKTLLARIAPEEGSGYVPAHAQMAQLLLHELPPQPSSQSRELMESVVHHAEQAKDWERVPRTVLLAASDLNMILGRFPEAAELLRISAERTPEDTFALTQLARQTKNQRLFDEVLPKAQRVLTDALAKDAGNHAARLRLAQLHAMTGKFDAAEDLLQQIPAESRSPEVNRLLSNLYLARYEASLTVKDGQGSVNFQYLDSALRIDPANPLIAQSLAKLARMQGPQPPQELIAHLIERLAAGATTAATHAYLAELYLLQQNYSKAIPHLEQVVTRLPNAAQYLNNLAYCLAELQPTRYDEALGYSLRAIELAKAQPVADYYDTLSYVLARLGRHSEAVTAIESAIELNPNRPDFHTRAAAEYRHLDMEPLAIAHERLVQRLQAETASAPKESSAPQAASADGTEEGATKEGATKEGATEEGATEEGATEEVSKPGATNQEVGNNQAGG